MLLWESGNFPTRPASELREERTEMRYLPADVVDRWRAVLMSDFFGDAASPSRGTGLVCLARMCYK